MVFSGFDVHKFANMSYLQRIDLLTERFVGKKRAFRVRLRRGDRSERMLISLIRAEELPENVASPAKKGKLADGS